jgi:hypothetical protein
VDFWHRGQQRALSASLLMIAYPMISFCWFWRHLCWNGRQAIPNKLNLFSQDPQAYCALQLIRINQPPWILSEAALRIKYMH